METATLAAGIGGLALLTGAALAYERGRSQDHASTPGRRWGSGARVLQFGGILLIAAVFLPETLTADRLAALDTTVARLQARTDDLTRSIESWPTPTPSPSYEAGAPVPVTPPEHPLEQGPECNWAGPASGFQQAGGRLCVYRTERDESFFHLTLRIGDACTGRGIPTAEVVIKWRRWMLRSTSERGSSVAFMNLPASKKARSAVTIITAPGYRNDIQRERYAGGEMWIGSPNLIPLPGVVRPKDCRGVTFIRPRYLRRD